MNISSDHHANKLNATANHSIVSDHFAAMLGALGHSDNKNQLEPKKLEFFAFVAPPKVGSSFTSVSVFK